MPGRGSGEFKARLKLCVLEEGRLRLKEMLQVELEPGGKEELHSFPIVNSFMAPLTSFGGLLLAQMPASEKPEQLKKK